MEATKPVIGQFLGLQIQKGKGVHQNSKQPSCKKGVEPQIKPRWKSLRHPKMVSLMENFK